MSSQILGFSPSALTFPSFSQSRSAIWLYVPAGEACVTRVVVTIPVDFPAA